MEGKVDKRSGIMAVNGIGELQNKKHTTAPQSIYIVDVFISLFILPRIYRREREIAFFSKTDFSNAERLFFLNTSEDKYLMFPKWMGVGGGVGSGVEISANQLSCCSGFRLYCHLTILTDTHRDFTTTEVTFAFTSVLRVNSDLRKWFDPVYWD